jgi:hypothetical protein
MGSLWAWEYTPGIVTPSVLGRTLFVYLDGWDIKTPSTRQYATKDAAMRALGEAYDRLTN